MKCFLFAIFSRVCICNVGLGEVELDPIFMTEVNVDRSKPCSHSEVVFFVAAWLLAVIPFGSSLHVKAWEYQLVLCSGLNLHLNKLLLTGFAAVECFPLWTSIDISRV